MTRGALSFDGAAGIRLAGDTFGNPDARPVLMLHGGGQTRHAWEATATAVAQDRWHVITVDLRGHGESTHPQPPAYALDDFVDDVRAVISVMSEAPIVIGASLGGMAGLLAITESPAAPAAGLVLVDVAHRFEPRGGERIVSFMETHLNGFASLTDAADAIATYLPHRVRPGNPTGLRHNLRHNAGRWTWHWDPEILTEARRIIHCRTELSARLIKAVTQFREPCLLVRGAESDAVTAAVAREFVDLAPTATVTEVPRAAHMVAGDNNAAFTSAIRQWLREEALSQPP